MSDEKSKNQIANEAYETLKRYKRITTLQGREYVTHKGLVWLAHIKGLQSVDVEMVHSDFEKFLFIFKATVVGERGTYVGHGDASTKSVSKGSEICTTKGVTRHSFFLVTKVQFHFFLFEFSISHRKKTIFF